MGGWGAGGAPKIVPLIKSISVYEEKDKKEKKHEHGMRQKSEGQREEEQKFARSPSWIQNQHLCLGKNEGERELVALPPGCGAEC